MTNIFPEAAQLNWDKNTSSIVLSQDQIMKLAELYREKYPEEMHILDITGVSPFWTKEMTNPYTKVIDTEDFSNVGRHCVSVGFAASKIADAMIEKGLITQNTKEEIIKTALLHDGDKRLEVMRKKAKNAWVRDTDGNSIDVYGEAWYKTIESVFSEKWLDPQILGTIKTMGGMTAHNSTKNFLVIDNWQLVINPERTLAEMIVHIADDMTHSSTGVHTETTTYVSFEDRARLWDFEKRYSFLWQEGFSVSSRGITPIKNIDTYILDNEDEVHHFYDWMKITFEMICQNLQQKLSPESNEISVVFMVWLVNTSVHSLQKDIGASVQQTLIQNTL